MNTTPDNQTRPMPHPPGPATHDLVAAVRTFIDATFGSSDNLLEVNGCSMPGIQWDFKAGPEGARFDLRIDAALWDRHRSPDPTLVDNTPVQL